MLFVIINFANATMAQLVEHILGKDEVAGSIPASSSKKSYTKVWDFLLITSSLLPLTSYLFTLTSYLLLLTSYL